MVKQSIFIIPTFFVFYFLNINVSKISTENSLSKIIIPEQYSTLLHLGQKDLISSITWIDLIQNSTVKKDDIPFELSRSMFISNLSPYFYFNYKYNGTLISIAKDQFENSNIVLKKGLKYFPDDYELLFQLGFNYYFLQNEVMKGLEVFSKIYTLKIYEGKNPTFPIIYSNIQKKIGRKKVAKQILYDLLLKTDNQNLIKVLKSKLKN